MKRRLLIWSLWLLSPPAPDCSITSPFCMSKTLLLGFLPVLCSFKASYLEAYKNGTGVVCVGKKTLIYTGLCAERGLLNQIWWIKYRPIVKVGRITWVILLGVGFLQQSRTEAKNILFPVLDWGELVTTCCVENWLAYCLEDAGSNCTLSKGVFFFFVKAVFHDWMTRYK